MNRYLTLTAATAVLALVTGSPAIAQVPGTQAPGSIDAGVSAGGMTQFKDERTGKVWTPENVSKDNQTPQQQAAVPSSPSDKAFDPSSQLTATQVVVQRPRGSLMGVVPITAGPSVPAVVIDSPWLQAVPQQNWLSVLYVTNNSANVVDPVVGCVFTNGGRPVQDTRIVLSPAGPGERWGVPVYGPPVSTFVDRVTCRLLSPA
ncbi:hypothetical protein [Reyranella sp.]|uniref:hypothetical protein n=1 Tax=Reyranella sp. TaxID=1929291 RepID=UPI003BACBBE0